MADIIHDAAVHVLETEHGRSHDEADKIARWWIAENESISLAECLKLWDLHKGVDELRPLSDAQVARVGTILKASMPSENR